MSDLNQNCRITGRAFVVNDWEQAFLNKMHMPVPTLCVTERHRKRLAHRNERSIYKSKCAISGADIISVFSPDKPFKALAQKVWWGDDWDAKDYGREYNFSRPFFDQFYDLQLEVPHLSLLNKQAENSEYCNATIGNRNCYLVFGGDFNEDCMYSLFSMHSKNCSDVYFVSKSELTYASLDCTNCYNVMYAQNSYNCRDSSFLFECRNVINSLACVGLRNKEYHIFNKKYSKEEYEAKIKEFRLDTWSGIKKMRSDFMKFKLQFPHPYARIVNSEASTGNNITDAKNCVNCFTIEGPIEDCKDVFLAGWGAKDIMSSSHVGHKTELFYEVANSIDGYNCAFCTFTWSSQNTFYCDMVVNCKNLFGCSNMKRAEYCILNKQYTKEEYEALLPRIMEHMKSTGEWGEFFPIKYSKFGYNETAAQDYFPIDEDEAEQQGWKWKGEKTSNMGNAKELPDSIHDVTEDICKRTLVCERTGKYYRIIPSELRFYKKMGIPIPRYAPESRNKTRIVMRNPFWTYPRNCAKCEVDLETSYGPNRPEIIYCEKCYLEVVY